MGLFKKKEKRIIKNRVTTQYDLSDKKYRYRYKVKGEKQSSSQNCNDDVIYRFTIRKLRVGQKIDYF